MQLLLFLLSTPLSPSPAFDVLLKMSPVVKAFFFPFSNTYASETICCRSPPLPFTHNAYQFPQLSGSQPPVSEMTFPASLCCPTDVLSETNQAKENTIRKRTTDNMDRRVSTVSMLDEHIIDMYQTFTFKSKIGQNCITDCY